MPPEMAAKLAGMSEAPGRSQASSHRSAQHEGIPMTEAERQAFFAERRAAREARRAADGASGGGQGEGAAGAR